MTKRYFTEEHQWVSLDNGVATIGITQYAQDQLGDLVFVQLPNVGTHMTKGAVIAVVESVKTASDIYAPFEGDVTAINNALSAQPALINQDAEGNGWLWKMTIANESELSSLMDEDAYKAMVG